MFVYNTALPYDWGSLDIRSKHEYLLSNAKKYNTIFIGSSKTHNQIVPDLFDKKARENNLNISSFNFGTSGLLPLESVYIYKNLLEQDSLFFDNVFLEINWIETINYENLNQIRSYYWLTPENYFNSMHSLFTSSVPLANGLWGSFHYSVDFIENMLNVGKVQEYLRIKDDTMSHFMAKSNSYDALQGFEPLPKKMGESEYNAFNEVIHSGKSAALNIEVLKAKRPSSGFVQVLQEVVDLSRRKGIKLYFLVPLQWRYFQYEEIIPAIYKINDVDRLILFDADKYKSIYVTENFADPNHLNEKGAISYTQAVFDLFKSRLKH